MKDNLHMVIFIWFLFKLLVYSCLQLLTKSLQINHISLYFLSESVFVGKISAIKHELIIIKKP